jgi:hypothetical protein
MLSNKEVEALIIKIDIGVKLSVKKALAKIKVSEHPLVPIQKSRKLEWVNLRENNS